MSCNTCNNNPCNCYPSIPNQWQTCPPTVNTCPPTACAPAACAPIGLNLLYAGIATINLEFFNMPVVPKILIAAPGPGKLIVPISMWSFLAFGTTPYSDGVGIPTIKMDIGSQGIITDSAILGALADQTTQYTLPIYTTPGNLANQPLTLSTISQPIVGDSVLYSYIIYTIVNL